MNITETPSYDKDGERPWQKLYLALVIILVGTLGFGIGRLSSTGESSGIKIDYDPSLSAFMGPAEAGESQTASAVNAFDKAPAPLAGELVASKNGTKYHYSHCQGAKQIREENRISFKSAQEAEASGYTLASNCKPR
jgi:hypothetical protein